jgi:hypothetical protein
LPPGDGDEDIPVHVTDNHGKIGICEAIIEGLEAKAKANQETPEAKIDSIQKRLEVIKYMEANQEK